VQLPLELPKRVEWGAAALTAILLILSFPNLELSFLAWVALVPLMWAVSRRASPFSAFLLGWAAGTAFFYGSCYWLTYSMIHYGGLPTIVAYLLLIPGALVVGIFPGVFAFLLALAVKKWGQLAVLWAPVFWPATEWARLAVTGQLWNALGYSQAYHPALIRPAVWGGVYGVGFVIVAINTAVVLVLTPRRKEVGIAIATGLVLLAVSLVSVSPLFVSFTDASIKPPVTVIALQPNVPMNLVKSTDEMKELLDRHWSMSTSALKSLPNDNRTRFVIWPESPMNFTYASDQTFQQQLATFTRQNHTSLLFNSLEPTLTNGFYNSALLVNEEGRMIAQYDKIRLMPFGEYVPLPQWLPGASLITGLVGDFTPGDKYTLMPVGERRAGTFICIESAYPFIARRLTSEGADLLINISNDGYLGPTAVMRQHLANVVFRAVENGRPVLRVTNTGLTAKIDALGKIEDVTTPFHADVRVWDVPVRLIGSTFYTRHGDVFVYVCIAITVLVFFAILTSNRRSFRQAR
jgi:apolipoprotein N-acyltransferase